MRIHGIMGIPNYGFRIKSGMTGVFQSTQSEISGIFSKALLLTNFAAIMALEER